MPSKDNGGKPKMTIAIIWFRQRFPTLVSGRKQFDDFGN